jgi:hypothetical protein
MFLKLYKSLEIILYVYDQYVVFKFLLYLFYFLLLEN